ncbi:hypothetical protein SJAG_05118 [Schizosaccharomyces japonicus yFS275]|uniref:CCHC-type domain-containing protein n=1 Tax=Schizosaccharomyces japonicus (strain yFS275 / FY16936) TaxID=402676 RepID=B6K8G5_SCHJY|nr:hypothetical protein SJAG_05118 [Schizosaccharomyces japonicus yFS275]EEB05005.1 hypothetical protein SJAG_05118 [Schizosaccharomyces japonicus yFS275]
MQMDAMRVQGAGSSERVRLFVEGRCFKCWQVGHLARNCPSNKRTPNRGPVPIPVIYLDQEGREVSPPKTQRQEKTERKPRNDETTSRSPVDPEYNLFDNYSPLQANMVGRLTLAPLVCSQLTGLLPAVEAPPLVHCKLMGQDCRALLDTGCATYIVSEDFALRHGLPILQTASRPVQLAVETKELVVLDRCTAPITVQIGNTVTKQSFFVAKQAAEHDAILGIPFWNNFGVQLNGNRVRINGDQVSRARHLEKRPWIAVECVSRKTMKKQLDRSDEIRFLLQLRAMLVLTERWKKQDHIHNYRS